MENATETTTAATIAPLIPAGAATFEIDSGYGGTFGHIEKNGVRMGLIKEDIENLESFDLSTLRLWNTCNNVARLLSISVEIQGWDLETGERATMVLDQNDIAAAVVFFQGAGETFTTFEEHNGEPCARG